MIRLCVNQNNFYESLNESKEKKSDTKKSNLLKIHSVIIKDCNLSRNDKSQSVQIGSVSMLSTSNWMKWIKSIKQKLMAGNFSTRKRWKKKRKLLWKSWIFMVGRVIYKICGRKIWGICVKWVDVESKWSFKALNFVFQTKIKSRKFMKRLKKLFEGQSSSKVSKLNLSFKAPWTKKLTWNLKL